MKNTLLLILSLLLIVGCSTDKKYTETELNRLLDGKTKSEVKKLLGPPNGVERNLSEWYDRKRKRFISLTQLVDFKNWMEGAEKWNYDGALTKMMWDETTEKYNGFFVIFDGNRVYVVIDGGY